MIGQHYIYRIELHEIRSACRIVVDLEIMGTPVTANELAWLAALREASGDSGPRLTSRALTALRGIFGK